MSKVLPDREGGGLPQGSKTTAARINVLAAAKGELGASGALADMTWDWSPDLMKAQAYEQILLGIISGALAPGARLDEHDLKNRYGIGLAGVRDALGRLALESLVVRRPRSGTTVAPLDYREMDQVFEARRLIEPYCAALAAKNATSEELCSIRSSFVGAEQAIEQQDSLALVAMDQRFHAAVVRASRNATLVRIAIPLQHKASRFWVFAMESDTAAERLAEIQRHRAVADHIVKRDAAAAQAGMLAILGSPERIKQPLRSFSG